MRRAARVRVDAARSGMGYTRERFAELMDVSVSYMAEVERGRTGISVKMLMKLCRVLGLSADYILFGEAREADTALAAKIGRVDAKYLPMLEGMVDALLALNAEEKSASVDKGAP